MKRNHLYKHGMSKTHFYAKWCSIKQRCEYRKSVAFMSYGAKGIKCHWNKFEDFYRDMHASYLIHLKRYGTKNTTIDRIDNSGDYCKENCRWATLEQQANNKTSNKLVKINGIIKTVAEWSKVYGINKFLLYDRLRSGVKDNRKLLRPVGRFLKLNGKKKRLKDWSAETGLRSSTILQRLSYGWSVKKALTTKTK